MVKFPLVSSLSVFFSGKCNHFQPKQCSIKNLHQYYTFTQIKKKEIQGLELNCFSATPWKQQAQNIQNRRKKMHSPVLNHLWSFINNKVEEGKGLQNKDYWLAPFVHSEKRTSTNLFWFSLLERISYHSNWYITSFATPEVCRAVLKRKKC